MPEMQPSTPSDAAMPVSMAAMPTFDDIDYALGCECADPSLQIERWGQEASGPGEAN
ncbi:hypothetical protein [Ramlibacter pallidus]|uniref:Uncharacterized protein n=1 Tax=Ramlibacter pallidus TaxID=2780087 RepID=A0ABR9S4T7_9BURK|nr:hypothetical protein [Ramlibacter pallidus]MBE7368528.1 hypothetical protein [Ramlibacter pallidus]